MHERFEWYQHRDAMIAFAVRWAPFGGGTVEDIWTEFGLPERVYFLRMRQVLSGPTPPGLDDVSWERLRRVCDERIHLTDPDTPPTDQLPA
ncbi:hypothetical protein [Gordonia soli]|uniref:hypothetical protein n=1 Tax=Gordonia soli TaxID=320799 RepID=UPI00034C8913|nr:hypothetical protein [Gordonia soli]